jgi:hypothetical protein
VERERAPQFTDSSPVSHHPTPRRVLDRRDDDNLSIKRDLDLAASGLHCRRYAARAAVLDTAEIGIVSYGQSYCRHGSTPSS